MSSDIAVAPAVRRDPAEAPQAPERESTRRHLGEVFQRLFPTPAAKAEAGALALVMASVPVMEMLVIRMFTDLITTGADTLSRDPSAILRSSALFALLFATARILHHAVRVVRVSVFRRRFETSLVGRDRAQESWDWAMALELSTQMVGTVQIVALAALITVLDPVTGAATITSLAVVLVIIGRLFSGHLGLQRGYIAAGNASGSASVAERIHTRIRAAELGGVIGSLGMVVTLGCVLGRTVLGEVSAADAVVVLLACRIAYGQVSTLSSSTMRFARASARAHASRARTARSKPSGAELQHAVPAAKAPLWLLAAGQRGDTTTIDTIMAKVSPQARESEAVVAAHRAARSFAAHRTAHPGREPLPLAWWVRPLPGDAGDWMSPLAVGGLTRRDIDYVAPSSTSVEPHLVAHGTLGRLVAPSSIVVGAGIGSTDDPFSPDATYVSLRGPVSAAHLARRGGPDIDRWGDPLLLLRRLVPLEHGPGNGRVALVRDSRHARVDLVTPEEVDELTMTGGHPDEVRDLLAGLVAHDAVVTTSLPVLIACHSYGVAARLVGFEGVRPTRTDRALQLEDHVLGGGIEAPLEIPVLPHDLTRTDLRALTTEARADDATLDEIATAISEAVATLDRLTPHDDEEDDAA